ncbi:hypothetical protein ACVIJW_003433 [Bradyrhizobium barranii subsp. barranii]
MDRHHGLVDALLVGAAAVLVSRPELLGAVR